MSVFFRVAGARGSLALDINGVSVQRRIALIATLAVMTVGCGREDVHSYRVAKSVDDSLAGAGRARPQDINPELPTRAADGARVVWDVPGDWKVVQSDQPMRLATYDASGAEVTVAAFPGAVGGMLANVNRWRGQIGLAAIEERELAPLLSSTSDHGTDVATLAMTASDGRVMLGAVVTPGDGQTWFVKSTTDATRAAALRPAFDAFARSFRREGASAPASASASTRADQATTDQNSPPTSANASAGAPVQAMGAIEARLAHFAAPATWSAEAQAGGLVTAAFAATNAGGGARVTATSLANDGGGDLANINRWRGQLGLAAMADLAQVKRSPMGPGAMAVDLVNDAGTDRMIVAIITVDGATWFFKLRGTVAGVEAERAQFDAFVRAVGLGVAP